MERLFPGNDAVPAAGFYAGEALRLVRRHRRGARPVSPRLGGVSELALGRAREPGAPGYCLVQGDRAARGAAGNAARAPAAAAEPRWPADAININTILYRLYVRAPAAGAYASAAGSSATRRANFSDVIGVTVDRRQPRAARPQGPASRSSTRRASLTAHRGGAASRRRSSSTRPGRIVFARQATLLAEKARDDRDHRAAAGAEAAAPGRGDPVGRRPCPPGSGSSSTRKRRTVIRVRSQRQLPRATSSPTINTDRLAINALDDVAILDKDSKAITIVDRDGKLLSKVLPKGANYQFDEPVDLVFDQLGHLYVLDRGKVIGLCVRSEEPPDHHVHACREEPWRVYARPSRSASTPPAGCTSSTSASSASRFTNERSDTPVGFAPLPA